MKNISFESFSELHTSLQNNIGISQIANFKIGDQITLRDSNSKLMYVSAHQTDADVIIDNHKFEYMPENGTVYTSGLGTQPGPDFDNSAVISKLMQMVQSGRAEKVIFDHDEQIYFSETIFWQSNAEYLFEGGLRYTGSNTNATMLGQITKPDVSRMQGVEQSANLLGELSEGECLVSIKGSWNYKERSYTNPANYSPKAGDLVFVCTTDNLSYDEKRAVPTYSVLRKIVSVTDEGIELDKGVPGDGEYFISYGTLGHSKVPYGGEGNTYIAENVTLKGEIYSDLAIPVNFSASINTKTDLYVEGRSLVYGNGQRDSKVVVSGKFTDNNEIKIFSENFDITMRGEYVGGDAKHGSMIATGERGLSGTFREIDINAESWNGSGDVLFIANENIEIISANIIASPQNAFVRVGSASPSVAATGLKIGTMKVTSPTTISGNYFVVHETVESFSVENLEIEGSTSSRNGVLIRGGGSIEKIELSDTGLNIKHNSSTYIGQLIYSKIEAAEEKFYNFTPLPIEFFAISNNISKSIVGSGSDNYVIGSRESELIESNDGDDTIVSASGDDLIISGSGDDLIYGGSGNDLIFGGRGDDIIRAGHGRDVVLGDEGNDTILGASGLDHFFGGQGDDFIRGSSLSSSIFGGSGDDTIRGNGGLDELDGGGGNDFIHGGFQPDSIFGGSGNDKLFGGVGYDILYGGSGDDVQFGGANADNLHGEDGIDRLFGEDGLDRIFGGAEQDFIFGGNHADAVFGQAGNDFLYGGAGKDRGFGGISNDAIFGGTGNDTLSGGSGFDTIYGGPGNDVLFGGYNADIFVFSKGGGRDKIADFAVGNKYERIDLSGLDYGTNFDGMMSKNAVQLPEGVLLIFDSKNSLLLSNLALSDLTSEDFIF